MKTCIWSAKGRGLVVAMVVLSGGLVDALASDCDQTSVNLTPVNDLGAGLYLGQFEGGLFPGGSNTPPSGYFNAGVNRANSVRPRNAAGEPDPAGKAVLLSIGMSNTTQEFCAQGGGPPCDPWTFTGQALAHPNVNHSWLVIANGARGGQSAGTWDSPDDPNYDRVRDQVLAPMKLTEAQVQTVWVKQANPQPQVSLPSSKADAYLLMGQLGDIARAVKTRYPNVRIVFFSSRIYAGYASTTLNPEPYSYESAFSVKWLIEAQINQMSGGGIDGIAGDLNPNTVAPYVTWGPYLWADGLTPRSDGLTWACKDFQSDGTHPAQSGEEKVGTMLLDFMLTSPFSTPWFLEDGFVPGDVNGDGSVNVDDLLALLNTWGPCPGKAKCPGDLNFDNQVDVDDLLIVINNWS